MFHVDHYVDFGLGNVVVKYIAKHLDQSIML